MFTTEERQLLREGYRRVQPEARSSSASARLDDYLATLFPLQREVVECWDASLDVLCTRRAGKSKGVPGKLFVGAKRWPRTVIYYLHPDGGTRAAETLLGPDINIERVVKEYGLPWELNRNKLTLTNLDDGTEIRLRGADDIREARKRRGDKVSLVLCEETQNFPPAILKELEEDILGPALADVGGQFMRIGTPGPVCAGPWYEATRNEDDESRAKRVKGRRVYEWSALDNPFMREQAARHIAKKLAPFTDTAQDELAAMLLTADGRRRAELIAEASPSVLREWFGRWVNDAGALFYRYSEKRNAYDGRLPPGHTWRYVLGGDLGHRDAFALVVWAYSKTHPHLFQAFGFKKSGLIPSQWVEHIKAAMERYRPDRIVIDPGGLGSAFIDELNKRHAIPAQAAEKTKKVAFVELLNDDLAQGLVKVLPDGPLAHEWATLTRDSDDPTKEDERFDNHASDAGLYGWRECLHFLGRHPAEKPAPGTPEADEEWSREHEERLAREQQRQQREEDEERDAEW